MSALIIALSTWLHALATIVMIGYFIFTALVYLPVLERQLRADAVRCMLEQVSARLRPLFGGSLLIFLLTGTYLMLVNQNYPGLGNFFANPWSVLIVIKHVLIVPFLAIAMYSERAFLPQISEGKPQALRQFRQACNIDTVLGAAIILLTSVAQVG